MLDLSKYQSIGAALKDALEEFSGEVCLIEADRDREKERLTYRDFRDRAHPLARALQDAGFVAADRGNISYQAPYRARLGSTTTSSTRS